MLKKKCENTSKKIKIILYINYTFIICRKIKTYYKIKK